MRSCFLNWGIPDEMTKDYQFKRPERQRVGAGIDSEFEAQVLDDLEGHHEVHRD